MNNNIAAIEKAVLLQGKPVMLSDNVVAMPKAFYEQIREEWINNELRKSLIEAQNLPADEWLDWDTVIKEVEAEFLADL